MSDGKQKIDSGTGIQLSAILQIIGGLASTASVILAMGFVVINLSLLKHGVYEGALLRERYLAAGITFVLLLAGAAIFALAAYWVSGRLPLRRPVLIAIVTIVLLMGADYLLALAVWGFKGIDAFSRLLLGWMLVGGAMILVFLYANPLPWIKKPALLVQGHLEPLSEGPAEVTARFRGRAGNVGGLTLLGILFVLLLIVYGLFVHETLPAALGGGLPVVVQFAGEEGDLARLAQMGVPLESPTVTAQLEFIGQTDQRYFVFVREVTWEESPKGGVRVETRRSALAFDKNLVQGVRYFPSEYHLSDEFAAVTHTGRGDEMAVQEFYDSAIDEYNEALRRQPNYHPAYFKRGLAYLGIALSPKQDNRALMATQAVNDIDRARDLKPGEARYWYHLARAQSPAEMYAEAVETLSQAVEREAIYREHARSEPLFEILKVRADLEFGFETLLFGSTGEAARAYAAQGEKAFLAAPEAEDGGLREERLVEAELAYRRAISLTVAISMPLESAGYRDALAQVLMAREQPNLAAIQWELAVMAAPDNEGYRLQLARVYQDQGQLAEATVQYEALVIRNPKNLSAWLGKGQVSLALGDHDEASQAFQHAVELAPERAEAWYGLGVARLALDPGGAEAPLRQAVTLNPAYADRIDACLGGAVSEPGCSEFAALEAEVAERLGEIVVAARAVREGDNAMKERDFARAIVAYERAGDADPDNVEYLVKLGDAFRSSGDAGAQEAYVRASEIYSRAVALSPEAHARHFRLALTLDKQGKGVPALNAYDTAIKLAPEVGDYYAARADLYERLGRSGDAITDLEQAVAIDPSNYLYHGRLGRLYYDAARHDEAIAALTSATALNPGYATGLYYLGLAYLASDRGDEARAAFAACAEAAGTEELQAERCQDQLTLLSTPMPLLPTPTP